MPYKLASATKIISPCNIFSNLLLGLNQAHVHNTKPAADKMMGIHWRVSI